MRGRTVTGSVFTDSVGRPLLPEYVSHRFSRDLVHAGVPRIRFHDLRHSAATTLLAAGVPLAVISEWLDTPVSRSRRARTPPSCRSC